MEGHSTTTGPVLTTWQVSIILSVFAVLFFIILHIVGFMNWFRYSIPNVWMRTLCAGLLMGIAIFIVASVLMIGGSPHYQSREDQELDREQLQLLNRIL